MHNTPRRRFGLAAAALLLAGCASLPFGSSGEEDPLYKVENQSGGFTISTAFSLRLTDEAAVEAACRRGLVQNAQDLSNSLGRPIQPVDARRAQVTVSWESGAGMGRYEGSLPVTWVR